MPEIVQERTIEQRIAAIEDTCELIRADQIKLLEGIAKFFAMAEQMKTNPLFSALMPQQAPPQRKR